MGRIAAGLALVLVLEMAAALPGPPAAAGEPSRSASVAGTVGPDLAAAYGIDPAEVGLTGEAREGFERKRFEIQTQVIRLTAEAEVLRLQLSRLLDDRRFDLTAAQKKVGEISVVESRLRNVHVELAHALAGALSDEQWQLFRRLSEGAPGAAGTAPPPLPPSAEGEGVPGAGGRLPAPTQESPPPRGQ